MTFEKVAKIIAENREMNVADVQPESTFEELGFDSLDTVELIMSMEDEFGITLEMQDDIKTVGDVVSMIDRLK